MSTCSGGIRVLFAGVLDKSSPGLSSSDVAAYAKSKRRPGITRAAASKVKRISI